MSNNLNLPSHAGLVFVPKKTCHHTYFILRHFYLLPPYLFAVTRDLVQMDLHEHSNIIIFHRPTNSRARTERAIYTPLTPQLISIGKLLILNVVVLRLSWGFCAVRVLFPALVLFLTLWTESQNMATFR